ncbi:hypothetical protein, partial [Bradyrhizobium liaoningense]|uniref:hypothetical protein n=1 Tax=Bradyrhizobium liaoningense TaxID=43992 RepID=UPI001BA56A49
MKSAEHRSLGPIFQGPSAPQLSLPGQCAIAHQERAIQYAETVVIAYWIPCFREGFAKVGDLGMPDCSGARTGPWTVE